MSGCVCQAALCQLQKDDCSDPHCHRPTTMDLLQSSLVPRPIPSFSMLHAACNIEKLGIGLGTRLLQSSLALSFFIHSFCHSVINAPCLPSFQIAPLLASSSRKIAPLLKSEARCTLHVLCAHAYVRRKYSRQRERAKFGYVCP